MPGRGISKNPTGLTGKISKKFFIRNSPTGYAKIIFIKTLKISMESRK
jgi:hypothetical protein